MVTGDNIHTAKHIARECGIFSEGGIAMEGPEFRVLPDEELKAMLPRLQVMQCGLQNVIGVAGTWS